MNSLYASKQQVSAQQAGHALVIKAYAASCTQMRAYQTAIQLPQAAITQFLKGLLVVLTCVANLTCTMKLVRAKTSDGKG